MASLVPPPIEVNDGQGVAYVCEIVSVSDGDPDAVARHPERTLYREAALGVGCRFGDKTGVFYPIMWVSTEWALLRGLLNGYQKRMADGIFLTRMHPLNPGLRPLGTGSRLSGFCMKGPERTLWVDVDVREKGTSVDLPRFGATFGRRAFPRTDISQGAVSEIVEIAKSDQRTAEVWIGDGTFGSSFDLGETEPVKGAVYQSGFTISGSKVLA